MRGNGISGFDMSMQDTPNAVRLHIGIFGKRNSGKDVYKRQGMLLPVNFKCQCKDSGAVQIGINIRGYHCDGNLIFPAYFRQTFK